MKTSGPAIDLNASSSRMILVLVRGTKGFFSTVLKTCIPSFGSGCREHKDKSCYICERKMIYAQVALGKTMMSKEAMPESNHGLLGFSSITGSPQCTENLKYVIYNGKQAYPLFVITYKIRR